jgi:hypothetical protein
MSETQLQIPKKSHTNFLVNVASRNRDTAWIWAWNVCRIFVCGGVLSLRVEVIARGQVSQQESGTITAAPQADRTSDTTICFKLLYFSRCDAQRLMSSVCSKLTSLTVFFELEHSRRKVHYINLISRLVNTKFCYCNRSQVKREVHCSWRGI